MLLSPPAALLCGARGQDDEEPWEAMSPEERKCDDTGMYECLLAIRATIQNRTGTGATRVCE